MAEGKTENEARLSYDELVALLRRSTVLQRREDEREFGRGELLEAARELGVSEAVVTRAFQTHVSRRDAKALLPKPFDTRITLQSTPERLAMDVPPARFSMKIVPMLGFAVFWLSFVAFWTWGAAKGSTLFAAFSIPFWCVGAAMVWRVVRPLIQRVHLDLSPDAGRLEITPLGKKRDLRSTVLVARVGEMPRGATDDEGRRPAPVPVLVVEHGVETFHLLEGYSDQERSWVASELQAWLAQNNLDEPPAR